MVSPEGEDIISQFFSSFLKVLFNKTNLKSPVISVGEVESTDSKFGGIILKRLPKRL